MEPATQRTPSKWMVLAAAQSLLFLFGLPPLCRMYWDALFGSMPSQKISEILLVIVPPSVCVILYNIVMAPIYYYQIPYFEQYKIQKDRPWPWLDEREKVRRAFWDLSARSIKITAINLGIILPVMSIAKAFLIDEMLGTVNPRAFDTSDEHWPSPAENARNILLMAVLHEFGFYVTHRMLHAYPALYRYHKVHHEYKMNTTLAAQHNHPVDHVLSIGGPALLAVSLVNPHSVSVFQWTIYTMMGNLDDHVGYAFPWSPVRWFPFSAGTDEHEFHHSKNMGCFGFKLSIFNSLFGGYDCYLEKKFE